MTAPVAVAAEGEDVLIGRCYTKARRLPAAIGRWPGGNGGRIPGGPYTLTQIGLAVGGFLALLYTRPIWGGFGLADPIIALVVPCVLALGLRYVSTGGRNPLLVAAGAVQLLAAPRAGRLHGRPLPAHRPHPVGQVCTVTEHPDAETVEPAVRPTVQHRPEPVPALQVRSGVQQLLAQRAEKGA